jgi:hypothetical protein
MAVIEGGVSAALVGVGAEAASPQHVVGMPLSYGAGGHYRIAACSGTIAAGLVANSEIFQFRYITATSRICVVQRIQISAGTNLAATAAALTCFRATIARGWTVAGSGGTRFTLTGDQAQLRTSMAVSEVSDAGISTTGALTAGTKTLDTQDFGAVAFGIGTGALTTAVDLSLIPQTVLFGESDHGCHPLVLANQEGFVIRTGANAFPATMTWHFAVAVQWAEIPAF